MGVSPIEEDGVSSERVKSRSLDPGVSVHREAIRAERVDRDQDDRGSSELWTGMGTPVPPAGRDGEQEKDPAEEGGETGRSDPHMRLEDSVNPAKKNALARRPGHERNLVESSRTGPRR